MSNHSNITADEAPDLEAKGPNARFAYRRLGSDSGVPLVMCMRFRGTIDHWDPAFLDAVAAERPVIVFDNRGTGTSTGAPGSSVAELADGALEFIDTLDLGEVDLLGWSLGGIVAQAATLARPDLVRRLIVAGSSPGGVPDQPPAEQKVWQVALQPTNADEDFLYLFFPDTGRARELGLRSLRRIKHRLAGSHAALSPEAVKAQFAAISSFDGLWDQVGDLNLPVLVANGAHDVMIHAFASYAMSQHLPAGKVILYSDAGHGFLFQHPEEFAKQVRDFLR